MATVRENYLIYCSRICSLCAVYFSFFFFEVEKQNAGNNRLCTANY